MDRSSDHRTAAPAPRAPRPAPRPAPPRLAFPGPRPVRAPHRARPAGAARTPAPRARVVLTSCQAHHPDGRPYAGNMTTSSGSALTGAVRSGRVAPPSRVRGLPDLGRCAVMGVVNVTPDSFSDGGLFATTEAAVARGLELAASGADLVDVGGESTRPDAVRVDAAEELRRVVPVVRELAAAGVAVSVDTMRAEVAAAAVDAGARLVNDVSGGLADPAMTRVVADLGVAYVVMHWRGHGCATIDERAVYRDVVADVVTELRQRLEAVASAGVGEDQIILDPGLGFAKTGEHNWRLLAHLDAVTALGRPVLVAVSRKRFLGTLLADAQGRPRPVTERDDASAALSTLAAADGAWAVRVHETAATADAVRVVAALRGAR